MKYGDDEEAETHTKVTHYHPHNSAEEGSHNILPSTAESWWTKQAKATKTGDRQAARNCQNYLEICRNISSERSEQAVWVRSCHF